ncbi:uncharacterized protein CLUP02_16924 [Colletotrichum lupini]|uniref:Uncharacterized protein n=1 Tax=Colletotrichum lupini TaxID=145971 RepID=A0A9Q8WPZ8_9PEZI|nr:uncharacterized protein CLUP02_16924 [Colletotrichum lupini]UQC91389.1 hypothetical protein CLUP02_16924 [Colletotrichum lupini]
MGSDVQRIYIDMVEAASLTWFGRNIAAGASEEVDDDGNDNGTRPSSRDESQPSFSVARQELHSTFSSEPHFWLTTPRLQFTALAAYSNTEILASSDLILVIHFPLQTMSPAGSGSLGLVLLAHTTRCIITISYFCIDLANANLRLFSLWAKSCFLAASLNFHSFTQSIAIIVASSKHALGASQVTITVLIWAIPYIIFLECVLYVAALIILLEKCETVYLHLRPLGPVQRSSGPDLERAEAITVVSSINDTEKQYSDISQPTSDADSGRGHSTLGPTRQGGILKTSQASKAYGALESVNPDHRKSQGETNPPLQRQDVLSGRGSYQPYLTSQRQATVKDRRVLGEISHANADNTRIPYSDVAVLTQCERLHSQENQLISPSETAAQLSMARSHGVRRLSASFTTGGPLSSNPTIASFPVMAIKNTTHLRGPPHTSVPPEIERGAEETIESSRRNSPELGGRQKQSRSPKGGIEKQRLPKSRTFTVLSNLTASLSRTSLASFTGSDRKASLQTVASRKTSSSSTLTTSIPTRTPTPMSPEVNPLIITTAQPSAYWSGRFMSLQDRFQGESLQEQTLSIFVTAHASKASILAQQRAAYQGRGNLPLSTTTALDRYGTAAIQEAKRLSDEDNCSLRIFLHLQALCGTPEAQKSLHAWQEAYARRTGRSVLLPEGTNSDRGFVARLFSGSGGGRRSFGSSQLEREAGKGKQGNAMRASIM